LETYPPQVEVQLVRGFVEHRGRLGELRHEIAPHAHALASLPRETERNLAHPRSLRGIDHSITHEPHESPPPNPTISTTSPGRMRPERYASSRQIGIDAADV